MSTTQAQSSAKTEPPVQHAGRVEPKEETPRAAERYGDVRAGVAAIDLLPATYGVAPGALSAIQHLQRVYGNQAVQRLIAGRLQSAPADRVARRPVVQRQADEEEEVQTLPLQRAGGEEEEVQTLRLQRQGDEEEVQTLRLQRAGEEEEEVVQSLSLQRQGEEEDLQTRRVQRQGDEEELQTLRSPGAPRVQRTVRQPEAGSRAAAHAGRPPAVQRRGADRRSVTASLPGTNRPVVQRAGGKAKELLGGVGGTISMFLDLGEAVSKFRESKADERLMQGAVLAAEGTSAIAGGAAGGAAIVSESQKLAKGAAGSAAELASGITSQVSGGLDSIKGTFFTIKNIVELVRKAGEMSSEDKFHATMEIVTNLFETAKSGVEMAKSFVEMFTSGPNAALAATVPGFGIAVASVDVIVRAVDLIIAAIRMTDMRKRKRLFKADIGGVKGKSSVEQAEAILKGTVTATDAQKKAATDYLQTKGLQYINQKRIGRAVLKICVAMAQISGEVTTLGGVSAPVGIAIKAAAVALDVGAGLFRRFKQLMRDVASERMTSPTKRDSKVTKMLTAIFNTKKTTKAKDEGYQKQYVWLSTKIVDAFKQWDDWQNLPNTTDAEKAARDRAQAEAQKIINETIDYMEAMGVGVKKLWALRGDPLKLRETILDALKKRD